MVWVIRITYQSSHDFFDATVPDTFPLRPSKSEVRRMIDEVDADGCLEFSLAWLETHRNGGSFHPWGSMYGMVNVGKYTSPMDPMGMFFCCWEMFGRLFGKHWPLCLGRLPFFLLRWTAFVSLFGGEGLAGVGSSWEQRETNPDIPFYWLVCIYIYISRDPYIYLLMIHSGKLTFEDVLPIKYGEFPLLC